MCNTDEYNRKLKDEINEAYYNEKQYTKALELSRKLLKIIKQNTTQKINDFYWIYNMLSLIYNQLDDVKTALYYAKKSLVYSKSITDQKDAYWAIGRCYEEIDIDKSLFNYNICITKLCELFDEIDDYNNKKIKEQIASLKKNIAILLFDESKLQEPINIYKELYDDKYISYYEYKKDINSTYFSMCMHYIKSDLPDKEDSIHNLIKKMDDKSLISKIRDKMSNNIIMLAF